jgi:cytochrome c oxidase subunit 4
MHETEHQHQPVSFRTLVLTWLGLGLLTAVTVAASRIDLGAWNIWIALGIASTKSALVIFIFMNLRHETRLFRLGLLSTLTILAIFIGFTFFDVLYR